MTSPSMRRFPDSSAQPDKARDSEALRRDTEAFIKNGGKITKVARGVSADMTKAYSLRKH